MFHECFTGPEQSYQAYCLTPHACPWHFSASLSSRKQYDSTWWILILLSLLLPLYLIRDDNQNQSSNIYIYVFSFFPPLILVIWSGKYDLMLMFLTKSELFSREILDQSAQITVYSQELFSQVKLDQRAQVLSQSELFSQVKLDQRAQVLSQSELFSQIKLDNCDFINHDVQYWNVLNSWGLIPMWRLFEPVTGVYCAMIWLSSHLL